MAKPLRMVAALSGGVDSSVAAARMIDAGHDVIGVHLALAAPIQDFSDDRRGCTAPHHANDAQRVAQILGIPFEIWDFSQQFKAEVIDPFINAYAQGSTPNPCMRCNKKIKFSALLNRALELGFHRVITGHYARLTHGRLRRAVDRNKDQSYVLAVLDSHQLAHVSFPLGEYFKEDIRHEAAHRGLPVADKPDSHDICFIPTGDTRAFLHQHLGDQPGTVIDHDGHILAHHQGIYGFTIGQRKGLGIPGPRPDGQPRYVTKIDAQHRTIHVGPRRELSVRKLRGAYPIFPSATSFDHPVTCQIQVRAHGETYPGRAQLIDQHLCVHLDQPIEGVACGQTLVCYRPDRDGDEVIASATIVETSTES